MNECFIFKFVSLRLHLSLVCLFRNNLTSLDYKRSSISIDYLIKQERNQYIKE